MKALVGSHNYNLSTEQSDKDYKVFIAPTFEDLYLGKRFHKQTVTSTEDNDVHDIRKLIDLFFKSNINFLEVLASTELIIPQGNPEIEEIFSMRKEIFKINLPYLYNACKGMHIQKMNLLDKASEGNQYLLENFGYETKQAQHAYRCLKFIVDFAETDFEDFEGALKYTGEDEIFMRDIKNGVFKRETFENFISHYYESKFIHCKDKYYAFEPNFKLKAEMEEIIMGLIKRKVVG